MEVVVIVVDVQDVPPIFTTAPPVTRLPAGLLPGDKVNICAYFASQLYIPVCMYIIGHVHTFYYLYIVYYIVVSNLARVCTSVYVRALYLCIRCHGAGDGGMIMLVVKHIGGNSGGGGGSYLDFRLTHAVPTHNHAIRYKRLYVIHSNA